MSTDDDRGYFSTGDSASTTQSIGNPGSGASSSAGFYDDDAAFSNAPTSTFTGFGDETADAEKSRKAQWHGGLDFGLLVLRLALGGLFVGHGLDVLFGWFSDAGGIDTTRELLNHFGYSQTGILTWVLGVSETAGGALVILGLFFPIGASAILGVMACAIITKANWNVFLGGVETEIMYAAAAFTLLFTGPGRVAIDRHTPWWRNAPLFGFVFLVIAAGLSAATLLVYR